MIHYLYTLILVTHIYDSFSVTHRKCVGLNINNVCSCSWTILESIFYLAKNTIVRVNSLEPCLTLCTRRRGHCYIQYPALVRPLNMILSDISIHTKRLQRCWTLYVRNSFQMLVTESLCWWLFPHIGDFFQCQESATSISNRLPTSKNCHQHKLPRTSVTNIDVAITNLRFLWSFNNESVVCSR